ncbi:MAG: response regulator [Treponema sp.]|nr:response regulator [Treponema sp.]
MDSNIEQNDVNAFLNSVMKKKIIIIDDDPLVLKTIREYLKDEYDVSLARGGALAYRYLEQHHVDLIIIDFEMPGEKGDSVLLNIRKMPYAANASAIFLTGAADTKTVMEILKTKPQGYLVKPVSKEKLLEKVHEVLHKSVV